MTNATIRPNLPLGQRPKLLEMAGISKVFNGTVTALNGMNLTLNEGDFLSLLGPSGCGKSTALRLIAGLLRPTTGRILWTGAHDRGDIGVVFQEPTLMPWATVAYPGMNSRAGFRGRRSMATRFQLRPEWHAPCGRWRR